MSEKTERRLLAEQIAAEKNIKVKSAFRYIQRIVAGEGKQQIKTPKFKGISKELQAEIEDYKELEKELQEQLDKIEEMLMNGQKNFKIGMYAEYDFANSDNRNSKPRLVNFEIAPDEIDDLIDAMEKGFEKTANFLMGTKGANFMGENGKVKNVRNIEV